MAPPAERPAAPDGTVLTELGHDGKARLFILTALGGWPDGRPDLGIHYDVVPWPERPLAAVREELAASEAARSDADAASRRPGGRPRRASPSSRAAPPPSSGSRKCGRAWTRRARSPCSPATSRRRSRTPCGRLPPRTAGACSSTTPSRARTCPSSCSSRAGCGPSARCSTSCTSTRATGSGTSAGSSCPFFSLFFAMIVGDAGYATLLLILTAVLQWRLKKVAVARVPHDVHRRASRRSSGACSAGSYFGIPTLPRFLGAAPGRLARRPRQPHRPVLPHRRRPSLVRARLERRVVLQARGSGPRCWRRRAGCIVVWSMFFLARQAVLGRAMPEFLLYALAVAILLVAAVHEDSAGVQDGVDRPRHAAADVDRQLRRHPLVHPPVRRRLRVGGRARRLQRHGGVASASTACSRRSPRACCSCSPTRSTSSSPASACSSTPCGSTRSSSRPTRVWPGRATTCTRRSPKRRERSMTTPQRRPT